MTLNAVFGYSIGGKIYNYSRQEYDSDGTYTDRNQMKLKDGWNRGKDREILPLIPLPNIIIKIKETLHLPAIWKTATT